MPFNGNALAKYLVMVSQVIAWCTVSVMLLRRGLNQVHAVTEQPPTHAKAAYVQGTTARGVVVVVVDSDRDSNATTEPTTAATAAAGHGETKSFDDTSTPAVIAGVIMIAIAVIMLIISPTIMLMKMIEKRKRRILDAEFESPPKYEDVVESAPRYSSLFVFNNEGEMVLLSENKHKEKDGVPK